VSSSPTDLQLVDVTMPQMGVSVAEGTVVEWFKQPGDWVEADEIIASISTDKIDTDVESPTGGRVQEILVEVGATVDVGTVMARIATDATPGDAHTAEAGSTGTSEASAALEAPGDAGELQGDTGDVHEWSAQSDAAAPARRGGPRRYSPVVMRIAAEHDLDLDHIEGTGRGGRVRKQDVLAFLENGGARDEAGEEGRMPEAEAPMHIESPYRPEAPAGPRKPRAPRFGAAAPAATADSDLGPVQSGPLSRMRQSIGRRMHESLQTSATCTTVIEADLTRIAKAREGSRTTYLPYVARATIDTLREFPSLNATLEGEIFTQYEAVHLGIAVSLGGKRSGGEREARDSGLIVPVIHNAQELSIEGLAARIRELAARARDNELKPDDVRGGTFTITNPGGYGSILATPVINQPQVAILDTEAVVKRPVVVTDELGNDAIVVRSMTYLCMSWDHRALDGALAAQFLAALRTRLESWAPDGMVA
jgi:pyruvate/2-oxoglutarate dehydrogenase complex dihydrolipoamide acyltransferase (E2) component